MPVSLNNQSLRYSPQLDGLRAFCIIFTLFNHIEGAPSYILGPVGVYVFFPLSGFLITNILLDGGSYKSYYIKRFFRIAPLYYLALSLTAIATYVTYLLNIAPDKVSQLGEIFIPSLLFSRELVNSVSAPTLFGQAWTIGVEEKFYLIFPLFIIVARRSSLNLLYLTAVFCLIFHVIVIYTEPQWVGGYLGIGYGVLAAVLYRLYGFSLDVKISLALVILAYVINMRFRPADGMLLISITASFFIVSLYASEDSKVSRFLRMKIFVYLGRLTYSIYLFHVLILYAVKLVLQKLGAGHFILVFIFGYALCVLSCHFVYRYIEHPLIIKGKAMAAAVASGKSKEDGFKGGTT